MEFALKEAHDRTLAAEDNARFLKTECESRRKETLTVIRKDYDERLKHVEHEHKVSTPTPQPPCVSRLSHTDSHEPWLGFHCTSPCN